MHLVFKIEAAKTFVSFFCLEYKGLNCPHEALPPELPEVVLPELSSIGVKSHTRLDCSKVGRVANAAASQGV